MKTFQLCCIGQAVLFFVAGCSMAQRAETAAGEFRMTFADNALMLHHPLLPAEGIKVWYLEDYVRPGSTNRDFALSVIPHGTQVTSGSADGKRIELRDTLADGVVVDHVITAGADEIDFHLTAHNPTDHASEVDWAEPCIQVGPFTGHSTPMAGLEEPSFLRKCFVFLDGKLERMPTRDWATEALYTPGQVWAAPGVSRDDQNPRPLSPHSPSNGVIGCYSGDEKWILATAWMPYQHLFQGIFRCIHSNFQIGGLAPGRTKTIRGKIYLVVNDEEALLERYRRDFPE